MYTDTAKCSTRICHILCTKTGETNSIDTDHLFEPLVFIGVVSKELHIFVILEI